MDRRRFLELLTKATVGGAVAYSFPDVIVPKNIEVKAASIGWTDYGKPISFEDLYKAYAECCRGKSEPNLLLVNKTQFEYINSLYNLETRFMGKQDGLQFFGAEIKFEAFVKENEVWVYSDIDRIKVKNIGV